MLIGDELLTLVTTYFRLALFSPETWSWNRQHKILRIVLWLCLRSGSFNKILCQRLRELLLSRWFFIDGCLTPWSPRNGLQQYISVTARATKQASVLNEWVGRSQSLISSKACSPELLGTQQATGCSCGGPAAGQSLPACGSASSGDVMPWSRLWFSLHDVSSAIDSHSNIQSTIKRIIHNSF